jgi:DNA primase
MRIEHIGFVEKPSEAGPMLEIGYRLTYAGGGSSVQRDRGTRTRLLEANKKAAEFYAAALRTPEAAPAIRFLTSRGFDSAAAERFGCGFAPAGWDALTKHLLAAGFSLDELMKAGLSKEGRRGPIDRFHRRLLWPIRDLGGDVVGFGGRRIFDDDPIEAKYLNTPETPGTARRACGLDLAEAGDRKSARSSWSRATRTSWRCTFAGVPTAVVVRHGVRGRSTSSGSGADRRRSRPRRGHSTFDGDAAGRPPRSARSTAAELDPDLRDDRAERQDLCDLRLNAGEYAVRDPRGPAEPIYELVIRSIPRDCDLDPPRGGWRPCSGASRWSPTSSGRSCATSTRAGSPAGRPGRTSSR